MHFSWSIPVFGEFPVSPGQSVVCSIFNSRDVLAFLLHVAARPLTFCLRNSSCCCMFSTFVLEHEVGDRFLTNLGCSPSDWAP